MDGAKNDTLTHPVTNLGDSGKQFTFDYQYTRGSAATTMTVSYNGVVYATATSPGSNASQGVTWEASKGATVSPTSVATSGTSTAITITLPDSAPANGDLVFTANPVGASTVPNDDHHVGNVKATSTNCADFAVTKQGPAAVRPGGSVEYKIDVTNSGPSKDTYTVSDTLPAGLTEATTSTRGCTIASGTLTCKGTALPVGSKRTITVQGKAPATDGSTLSNTASVKGTLTDQDTSDNTSQTVNTSVDAKLVEPSVTPVPSSSAAHPPGRDALPGRQPDRDSGDRPGHQAADRAESGLSGPHGSPSNIAVNTGIPAAASAWSLAFGIVLLLCGGLGLWLAVRARGLRIRTFHG
ncbi:hypothetical protein [Streptomyces sp. bgisy084]|uniref:hypothetical protein n=1 Tax=Streptomyces sp. bgisy084 TaxID=3413777 RepID=UPI003D7253B8